MKPCLTKDALPQTLHHYDGSWCRISGHHHRLRGDCSGLHGDCSGLHGNIDYAGITSGERSRGFDIRELVTP